MISSGSIKIQLCEDDALWNAKVSAAPDSWLSHMSQWRDTLEASFPHIKCIPLLIENSGDHVTTLPLYRISSIIGGTRYVSVPFSSISYILCGSPEQFMALADYFNKIREEKNKRISIEIRSNVPHALFEKSGLFNSSQNYLHHFLDLEKDSDAIYNSFHETAVKQPIKKSEKSGLLLRRANQLSEVKDFYTLYCLTRKRQGLPPMPLVFLENLFSNFFVKGALEIYFADFERKAVAGLVPLKYRDMVLVEFAGDDFVHRKLFPNHFLYWNCIKLAHKEGFKKFSFGRTYHLNDSLLQFKRRWGTQEGWMHDYRYPKTSAQDNPKENSFAYRFFRHVSPLLPMPLFQVMGNIIYRYLD